uniref:Uncharacterized protein n=1 Tax=Cryptosporidium parvum TaxID=5807 RepID=F0X5Y7_CRYPV
MCTDKLITQKVRQGKSITDVSKRTASYLTLNLQIILCLTKLYQINKLPL